jgi:hypothetical protein
MRNTANTLAALFVLAVACAPTQTETSPTVAPAVGPVVPADAEPHHELNLPPVGPSVHVTLEGKAADVVLASVPHDGGSAPLVELWKAAFPSEDPAALHFDLVGSDGFHPSSRTKCARLLTGAEVAAGHIDAVSHNVTFDEGLNLPGCYRVKAVVRVDATR